MENKFRNKSGSLTQYAFGCGYIENHAVANGRYDVQLSLDGDWHVKVRDEDLDLGLAAWESYSTLKEARRAVARARTYYAKRGDAEPVERRTAPDAKAPWA